MLLRQSLNGSLSIGGVRPMRNRHEDATFTDTVFGFFGVPSAKGRQKAVDQSDHAVNQTQCVIDDANRLQEALAELAGTLNPKGKK